MKNTSSTKYLILLGISLVSLIHINAQCLSQIFHASGNLTINGIQVTVSPIGYCDTTTAVCPSTLPYWIGANYTVKNQSGGYTFQFSPAVDSITLNLSAIHNAATNKEIVKVYVNGSHYSIPSVGQLNSCDSLAVLTPSGDITGVPSGYSSGCIGTKIVGPISEISIIDSVVIGAPNGSIFSLFFCSQNPTSIIEKILPKFLVYPIPTNGNITIEAPSKSKLEIFNMQGHTILQQTLLQESTDLDLSIVNKGIYILTISHNEKIERRIFVKE